MATPIAGMYKDYMPKLPLVRGLRSPQIAMLSRPTLEQLLSPSPKEQRLAMESQRLPSPAALSMFLSM